MSNARVMALICRLATWGRRFLSCSRVGKSPVAWLAGKGRQKVTALAAPLRATGQPGYAI
jgi:hypothetical protein